MSKINIVKICSWLLAALVLTLAVIVWASERLTGGTVTTYAIFPLLGLAAFSLMWTHYISGTIRRSLHVASVENKTFHEITGMAVLLFIILHPALLIIQLNKDGFGLPPESYLTVYSEPAMRFALLLGTISFCIFLLFEFKRKFSKKSWWRFIEYAQLLAMIFIFYHGLTLGRELSVTWYRSVWYLYGATFLMTVIYNYWYDRRVTKGGGHAAG